MQPLILVYFIGLFLHDALAESGGISQWPVVQMQWPWVVLLILAPKLVLGGAYHLLCGAVRRKLGDDQSRRRLKSLERVSRYVTILLMLSYLADLACGGLVWLRGWLWFGDTVLIDEVVFLLPSLAVMAWTWFAYYPLDKAMREAALIGRLDEGKPVHIWTRPQYMIANVRHQWVLLGVPLLLLMAWSDVFRRFIGPNLGWSEGWQQVLQTGGALTVFVFTSVMIRYLWDTVPLPDGELRRSLLEMCRQYRVRVRELLLWRTFGGVVNGAVMGLFGWVRYILLTDALLESLTPKQVKAVMAHELAHVRKHHMFWMVIIAVCSFDLLQKMWTLLFGWMFELIASDALSGVMPGGVLSVVENPNMVMLSGMILAIASWIYVFGWVSRRFERQADTFAVQHLAREQHASGDPLPTADQPIVITAVGQAVGQVGGAATVEAVMPGSDAWVTALAEGRLPAASVERVSSDHIPLASSNVMIGALQAVADLNCIPTSRPSWRHGSIKWRQDYLRDLAGKEIEDTEIDRQVLWIKLGATAMLAALVVLYVFAGE